MMGEFKFISKLKNIKGIGFIIIGIIAGIVLIIIGSINFNSDDAEPLIETAVTSTETYTEQLEKKLKDLIEGIDGVSGVSVMVTVDSSSEYIYAQNRDGEVREYVIINGADKSETPILVKEVTPQLRGVAVVCTGGNNPTVQAQIINLVSTLFNLSTNRIYVTG